MLNCVPAPLCRAVRAVSRHAAPRAVAAGGRALSAPARGIVSVEFAVLASVFLLVLVGIFQFGLTINNYMTLNSAAYQGAQTLALSRGTSTPYTKATSAINTAATNLTTSSLTVTLSVGGSTCNSDSGCQTLLSSGSGSTALVQISYPCNLTVMGTNFGGTNCKISTQSGQVVQ
jgi:Flp pilus assembly protein TadG